MKLNQSEKNALALCESINRNGHGSITIEWSRAGHPTLFNPGGQRCAHAGGGGYCKESMVLADALRFLCPIGSTDYCGIWAIGGSGVPAVALALAAYGWNLESSGSGKRFNCYTISRIGGGE